MPGWIIWSQCFVPLSAAVVKVPKSAFEDVPLSKSCDLPLLEGVQPDVVIYPSLSYVRAELRHWPFRVTWRFLLCHVMMAGGTKHMNKNCWVTNLLDAKTPMLQTFCWKPVGIQSCHTTVWITHYTLR